MKKAAIPSFGRFAAFCRCHDAIACVFLKSVTIFFFASDYDKCRRRKRAERRNSAVKTCTAPARRTGFFARLSMATAACRFGLRR